MRSHGIDDYRLSRLQPLWRARAIPDGCAPERRMGHSSHPTCGRSAARMRFEKTCKRRSQARSQTSKVHGEVAFWKSTSDFCSMMAVFGVSQHRPSNSLGDATMNWKRIVATFAVAALAVAPQALAAKGGAGGGGGGGG